MKASADSSSAAGFRILLIDDNRHGLVARRMVLQERGHRVTACSSPEEALAAFDNAEFDLIVTDYRMPNMCGIELIKVIRQKRPSMPIILISGMVGVLGLNEDNTGADEVVAKDGNEVSQITRAVERLLRRSRAKKPASARSQRGIGGSRRMQA